jgi:hypothetical protein
VCQGRTAETCVEPPEAGVRNTFNGLPLLPFAIISRLTPASAAPYAAPFGGSNTEACAKSIRIWNFWDTLPVNCQNHDIMTAVGWHVTGLGSLTAYIAPLDYNHLDITKMTQIHPQDLLNLTLTGLS